MTYTVTKITCSDCKHIFSGVLHDLLLVSKSYAATCPKCKLMTFFYGVSDIMGDEIPSESVKIKYILKL